MYKGRIQSISIHTIGNDHLLQEIYNFVNDLKSFNTNQVVTVFEMKQWTHSHIRQKKKNFCIGVTSPTVRKAPTIDVFFVLFCFVCFFVPGDIPMQTRLQVYTF